MNNTFAIAASLICADPLNLETAIHDIISTEIDYIHFDVMDGSCVPRFGLYPEILTRLRDLSDIPVDVHMMVENPEPYINTYAKAGANLLYVHVENNRNLHRTLKMIHASGMKAGVVLNMATPLYVLDYIIGEIDYVMLMAINPGIVGQGIIETVYTKIKDLKNRTGERNIKIVIDGGVTAESSAKLIRAGADMLVCGSSTIFRPQEGTLPELTAQFKSKVETDLQALA